MAYCKVSDVKLYARIQGDGDDQLLDILIARAQKIIEAITNRVFECSTNTSHYLQRQWLDHEDPYLLHMDGELVSVDTLKNGDSSATEIPNTEYYLTGSSGSRNLGPPYKAIRLKESSTHAWQWDTDGWVDVSGHWAYSDSPPDSIVHACVRLSIWLYRQRLEGNEAVTVSPEGYVSYPQKLPSDISELLQLYILPMANVGVG